MARSHCSDAELAAMAALLREREEVETRIGQLLGRPVLHGNIAEWIAAHIFDIQLETRGNAAAIDGVFTTGELAGKTVNVKYMGRDDRSALDMTPSPALDYYLVLTGPRKYGPMLPFRIDAVYLFDAHRLLTDLQGRELKIGYSASVRRELWPPAEVYPDAHCEVLKVSDSQRACLGMFGS